MDFYGILVLIFIVFIFVILLPTISGVGTFKVNNKKEHSNILKFKLEQEDRKQDDAATSSMKNKFEVNPRTGLKRRIIGKYNEDPNEFDFTVDDLINEDKVEEERERLQRLKKYDNDEQKANESFV
ncbi:hypothetical protein KAFR_0A06900 [Kazachstania africana CBS 2517]|uniref:Uncharacterized protein n=1 Tax=Kazachstania africana (strain ATCC 22294 / BCRC 22015 / CBS 2517 / CECT 1963 / NBRC 1671 / NRRL Y-8276) TaxID=1071382 RepID=H2AP25_KAZAF|nr:hypothetical protein KAFR_0A06900 [Kazachstania africana CBS 2517]CCF56125.1 hypothetical protein KAFR_0A06900 [Kazachstania africana CBS 2517]